MAITTNVYRVIPIRSRAAVPLHEPLHAASGNPAGRVIHGIRHDLPGPRYR